MSCLELRRFEEVSDDALMASARSVGKVGKRRLTLINDVCLDPGSNPNHPFDWSSEARTMTALDDFLILRHES
jgi:hypothetical protein